MRGVTVTMRKLFGAILIGFLLTGCQEKKHQETTPPAKEEAKMAMTVTSSAFIDGGMIPAQYTCDGADISPPLSISGVPEGTKSLALIADDPDAPSKTWVHWVMYNIPPDMTEIPENVPKEESLDFGAKQGVNDFGRIGYGGPCPPSGVHRYYFKLYALDTTLEMSGTVTMQKLLGAMSGHILAGGALMGKYQRP